MFCSPVKCRMVTENTIDKFLQWNFWRFCFTDGRNFSAWSFPFWFYQFWKFWKANLSPFSFQAIDFFSGSVCNLPASEIVIISSLSASLLNLTVSIDPNTACCIETIVKNKANGERIIFLFGESVWAESFECWIVFDWWILRDESSFINLRKVITEKWWCRRMWESHDFTTSTKTIKSMRTQSHARIYDHQLCKYCYACYSAFEDHICIGWSRITQAFWGCFRSCNTHCTLKCWPIHSHILLI